jgi:hypothetical protein
MGTGRYPRREKAGTVEKKFAGSRYQYAKKISRGFGLAAAYCYLQTLTTYLIENIRNK